MHFINTHQNKTNKNTWSGTCVCVVLWLHSWLVAKLSVFFKRKVQSKVTWPGPCPPLRELPDNRSLQELDVEWALQVEHREKKKPDPRPEKQQHKSPFTSWFPKCRSWQLPGESWSCCCDFIGLFVRIRCYCCSTELGAVCGSWICVCVYWEDMHMKPVTSLSYLKIIGYPNLIIAAKS